MSCIRCGLYELNYFMNVPNALKLQLLLKDVLSCNVEGMTDAHVRESHTVRKEMKVQPSAKHDL